MLYDTKKLPIKKAPGKPGLFSSGITLLGGSVALKEMNKKNSRYEKKLQISFPIPDRSEYLFL